MNSTLACLRSARAEDAESVEIDALEVVLATAGAGDLALSRSARQSGNPPGIVIAKLADISDDGQPIVSWTDGADVRREASRTIVPVDRRCIGSEVAVAFPVGSSQPLIMGRLAPPKATPSGPAPLPFEARVDNERLELTADREIVIRCGKASITLTRAGKVLIRGAYVLTRSSGVNRVKGASVQIN
jgi:hypothetical protein